ncbi:esterase-like activity of phytase family protein [Paenibacillus humicola]|uniref:esterase-like activity of phytase family protein n=1 Tax=Paenibacillus humicola TaxID=3110540 RepID=UPI00237AF69B|nr:esterase-like activity of phytase family protein [Paenibacillus humicola]
MIVIPFGKMITVCAAAGLLFAASAAADSADKPAAAGPVQPVQGQGHFGKTAKPIRVHRFVRHDDVGQLAFIGEQRISNDTQYKGTLVGGLSGIDYNPRTHRWIMISDDRSDHNPARFYTAKLKYDTKSFYSLKLTGVTELKQPDGTVYPNSSQYGTTHQGVVPDLESIRFDPSGKSVWYTSEGDRSLGFNPFIDQASMKGKYLSSYSIPDAVRMDSAAGGSKGFRSNLALEGSSFTPDGQFYFTSMEASLYQDGEISTVDNGSYSRITKYDRDGNIVAQFAYPVDPIPAKPGPGKSADNGVSDMLAINDHQFLMLERSGVQAADGSYTNYIRIYEADLDSATDVKDMDALKTGSFKPAAKRLVLILNSLHLPKLDNIEGISWGAKLKNGHDSLVVISDNNFNDSQVTQLLAFDVLPAAKG